MWFLQPLKTLLSNGSSNVCPLTPGHLLIGHCLTEYPEKDVVDVPHNRLSIYQDIFKNSKLLKTEVNRIFKSTSEQNKVDEAV